MLCSSLRQNVGGTWNIKPQSAAMFKICEELDTQMFTMFEAWAAHDLHGQFESDVKSLYQKYETGFDRNEDGQYEDPTLQVAFDVWKKAKGI